MSKLTTAAISRYAALSAGYLIILLTLAILLLWCIAPHFWQILQNNLINMTYHAAFGFFVLAMGILTCVYGFTKLSRFFASLGLALVFFEFSQLVLHSNHITNQKILDISRWLQFEHMSPNIIMIFGFASLALFLANSSEKRSNVLIAEWLGLVIFTLASVLLTSFFVGFQGIHFADNFSPIGINTAVCFLLLGTGLTASVWYRSQLSQIDLSKSLSLIIASGVFFATLLLWHSFISQSKVSIHEALPNAIIIFGLLIGAAFGLFIEFIQTTWRSSRELTKSLSLVKATLEATADGLLVVDNQQKIVDFNQKFLVMWEIVPAKLTAGMHLKKLLSHNEKIAEALVFSNKVSELKINPAAASFDEIMLHDGRVFECYSQPQWLNGQIIGRVWSFRDVTERHKMQAQIVHQATHDPLTNLPNRLLIIDRIQQAINYAKRTGLLLGVLFLDLDRFKIINDSLGHSDGDKILQMVAQRLQFCLRATDTLSRWGGDEFVISLTSLHREEDIVRVVTGCISTLLQPFSLEGREINVTSSIGVSIFPKDGGDAETLLRNSDAAMFLAKQKGRNTFQFYTQEMNVKALERLELEMDLRHALKHKEFSLNFQPILNLITNQISGFEALLRWQHPKRNVIMPKEFIGIAEETGLINEIGEWVMVTAFEQARRWLDQYGFPLHISINLSSQQFRQRHFVDDIARIIADSKMPSHLIEFELTESMIFDNVDIHDVLLEMKHLGASIVIDDFGIGYSSLSYLRRFPIDKLKIDQSFTHDMFTTQGGAYLVQAIIAMAKGLQLGIVAEGVQTEQQLRYLREHHCDEIQGFYYSQPLPASACHPFILQHH